jgi:FkbM family methyltransferase
VISSYNLRRFLAAWVSSRDVNSRIAVGIASAAARRHGVALNIRGDHVTLARDSEEFWLPSNQLALAPYVSENFDLFFSAIEPATSSSGQRIADFSKPAVHKLISPPMMIETAGFPDRLNFEDEYFHWYKPRQGDIVWDLGANVGIAALVMSELVGPTGHVLAVEPDPTNFHYLQANLARQRAANVTAINCAMSDSVGMAAFFADATMFSGLASTRSESVMRLPLGRAVEVKTETLDSLAEQYAVTTSRSTSRVRKSKHFDQQAELYQRCLASHARRTMSDKASERKPPSSSCCANWGMRSQLSDLLDPSSHGHEILQQAETNPVA